MKVMRYRIAILGLCLICSGKMVAAAEPQRPNSTADMHDAQPAPAPHNDPGQQPAAQAGNGANQNGNSELSEIRRATANILAELETLIQQNNERHGGAINPDFEHRMNQLLVQFQQNVEALHPLQANLERIQGAGQMPQIPQLTRGEMAFWGTVAGGVGVTGAIGLTQLAKYLAKPNKTTETISGGWFYEWVHSIINEGPTFLRWFDHHPAGWRDWAAIGGIGTLLGLTYATYKYYYPTVRRYNPYNH